MNDPFDIEWIQDDPLGRDVCMLKSVINAREGQGKHNGDEYLSVSEVKDLVADPARIDLTQQSPRHTEIYYGSAENKPYQYGRVVVKFEGNAGTAISWSRYKKHVSFVDVVYEKGSGIGNENV